MNASAPTTILYDGNCPICRRQAAALGRLDADRGRIALIDFTQPGFDFARHGVTPEALAGSIHAVLPGGRVVRGMEALRQAYRALGRGWLLAPTGWPGLRPLFDRLYRWVARHRMTISRTVCAGDRCG